ncbi:MAG: decarboxylating 6-phosphogluconate dehydrogenase [Dehalococcoidia bacterium]|nr:decarboxylating 6-phosphogluconate dehydrogenase [Dehalococcoidia bacterium]
MELGMIGLGRMGGNMAQRLVIGGHRVVTYDQDTDAVTASADFGGEGAGSLEDMVSRLALPRAVWIMVPAGQPTEDIIDEITQLLSPGDAILDGGNANYKDTMRRGEKLAAQAIDFIDVGTSGGIWGLTEGYSLMVGGDETAVKRLEPIFHTLAPAPDKGYSRVGPIGAGHFTKMVHNGVEYGLMQAYAEGFELLAAKEDFNFDLPAIAQTWSHGSVVRSWLLDLAADALKEDPELESLESYVDDSGEGRWAVQESVDLAVPIPVITMSLQARFRSRQNQPFGGRLLAALRNQFGGHSVRKSG